MGKEYSKSAARPRRTLFLGIVPTMHYILLVTYPGRKKQAAAPVSGCREMDLQKDRRMMMRTKEEITQTIKEQFVNVRERGRVLAQALKARADIAATRRRMRSTFADLGEAVYARLDAGESVDLEGIGDYKLRIEGLKAELRRCEEDLKKIMEGSTDEDGEEASAD